MRRVLAPTLLFVLFVAFLSVGAKCAAQSSWDVKNETDRLTDKRAVTATLTVKESPSSQHVYRLSLRCAGDDRTLVLSTWDLDRAAVGTISPRLIDWQSRVVQSVVNQTVVERETFVPRPFRYRIDSLPVTSASASYVSPNSAELSLAIFEASQRRIDSSGTLTAEQERALARLQDSIEGKDAAYRLPSSRLIVADVFINETVEFSFRDGLTQQNRNDIENACGFKDHAAAAAPAAWTDHATHEPLAIPDFWVRPGQLKPLRDYERLASILRIPDSITATRDQFETTAEFSERQKRLEAGTSELLAQPVLLIAEGGAGPNATFTYDADRASVRAVIIGNNRQPGYVSIKGNTYLSISTPYLEVVLLMPSGPFVRSAPAPKRSLGDILNKPLNSPRQAPTLTQLPVVCSFPMAADEARQRLNTLSLLFVAPIQTVLPRNGMLRGFTSGSTPPYGLVAEHPESVEMWVVDAATHERVGRMPLLSCVPKS